MVSNYFVNIYGFLNYFNNVFFSEFPSFWTALRGSAIDWRFVSEPQKYSFISTGGICQVPRGKVLGGTSSINGMIYIRGHRSNFDGWAEAGNVGWSYDEVLPYFKKIEKIEVDHLEDSEYHGNDGYVNIGYPKTISGNQKIFLEAGAEMKILNVGDDHNGEYQLGMARTQTNLRDGLRCGCEKAYLRPAKFRRNLSITLLSYVTKIVVDPVTKRARCVEFMRVGKKYRACARKEIILSAGAIQSPQLLLLSGIGELSQLREHQIPPIHNLPYVGYHLKDHPGHFTLFSLTNPNSTKPVSILSKDVISKKSIYDLFFKRKGLLLAHPFGETSAIINSRNQHPKNDSGDVMIVFGGTVDPYGIILDDGFNFDGCLIAAYALRTYSEGSVKLRSSNPYDPPLIDPNFYSDDRDVVAVVSQSIIVS